MLQTTSNLTIRGRLAIMLTVVVVGFVGFAALAYSVLDKVKVNGPVYAQIVQGKDLVADVLPPPEYIIESYLVACEELNETDPAAVAGLVARGQSLKKQYEERHEYWAKVLPDGQIKTLLLENSYAPAEAFFDVRDRLYTPALLRNDREAARKILVQQMKPQYDAHRAAIDEVVTNTNAANTNTEAAAASLVTSKTYLMMFAGLLAVGLSGVLGWQATRAVAKAIRTVIAETRRLSKAAVAGELQTRGNPDLVNREFRVVIECINETIGALVKHIDDMPIPAMIIDKEFTIRYMNEVGADAIGLPGDRLLGTKCYDHFKTSDCHTDRCACAAP